MNLSTWPRTSALELALVLLLCGCSSIDTDPEFIELAGENADESALDNTGAPPRSEEGDRTGGGDGDDEGSAGETGAGYEPAPDDEFIPPMEDPPTAVDPDDDPACDDQTVVELFLSSDDSNSMSSPVQAREAAMDTFSSLANVPIRPWEFLNYYDFEYPAAEPGQLTVTSSLVHDESMVAGEYLLQIGIASERIARDARAPMSITLVLDTSGSMGGHPIEMLKATCRAIASSLMAGDTISMVTWDTGNHVVFGGYAVTGPNDLELLEAIDALEASGGTDLHGGLVSGYELARGVYDAGRINRIVLISDGGANVGITDVDLIAEQAGGNEVDGIYMVGVGVGDALSYNDELMNNVTDVGKGAAVFIDSEAEAVKIFGQNFVNTVAVAARDVRVKLDLPPGFAIVRFAGEEVSADPAEIEPQHIAPNDTMVFHQRIETCAPDLAGDESEVTITVQYQDVITLEQREIATTTTFADLLAADPSQLRKGAAIFEYAEGLKAYRTAAPTERTEALAAAFVALERAESLLWQDPALVEIRTVLQNLR